MQTASRQNGSGQKIRARNKKFVSRFTQRYERGRSLKNKKIEYGEKRCSIWRMEFLHFAM